MSSILPTIEELKNLGAIFYDFDGVMTDNRVLVTDTGSEVVFCNRSDGLDAWWSCRAGIAVKYQKELVIIAFHDLFLCFILIFKIDIEQVIQWDDKG